MTTYANVIPRGAMVRASLSVALLIYGSAVAHSQWQNALKPPGAPAGEFKLIEAGKPVCTIVVSNATATVEGSAAQELQHWIQEITGVAPDIATADNAMTHSGLPADEQ